MIQIEEPTNMALQSFKSDAVSLEWNQNNLVLRRGDSVLLIESDKVNQLRTLKENTAFEEFFRTTALVNREARRVFQAWERKDKALIGKLYAEMMS
jgi:hypothetical protein